MGVLTEALDSMGAAARSELFGKGKQEPLCLL